jgi:phosphoglucosamine mutase
MITASHNPAADNGFKILGSRGRKLDDAQILTVESWMAEAVGTDPAFGEMTPVHDLAWEVWLDAVARATPGRELLAGKRIAVDLANGAASPSARWLVDNTEVDWVFIGDGDGAVNDGVGSEHLDALGRVVVEQQCVAGFAVDGDADRCRLVDGSGRPIPGDAVTWVLARAMRASRIAVTVMSNGALELSLPDTEVTRTPVGDRHLREAMDRHAIPLGAEESGHIVFEDHAAGDGIVTGLRALAALLGSGAPVSEVIAGFVPLPRILTKVPISCRPPLDEVAAIVDARADGLRKLGVGGRIFLRYSGTEPYMRVLVEGQESDVVTAISAHMTRVSGEALS